MMITPTEAELDAAVPPDAGPIVQDFYLFWRNAAAKAGGVPTRAACDPIDLARINPRALPHLWLFDVERDPLRIRMRLIGEAIARVWALGKPGLYIDEVLDHDTVTNVKELATAVCDTGVPNYHAGRPVFPSARNQGLIERIAAPLSSTGAEIDMVLGCSVYYLDEGFRADMKLI
ncbi:MAG: hypothetical protein QNJ84_00015 [Alphaproteobacteria bacterium]|nr:hypothetical protein [Alphaproteobacteria bacterium]